MKCVLGRKQCIPIHCALWLIRLELVRKLSKIRVTISVLVRVAYRINLVLTDAGLLV